MSAGSSGASCENRFLNEKDIGEKRQVEKPLKRQATRPRPNEECANFQQVN
jgi:hypothetical protein